MFISARNLASIYQSKAKFDKAEILQKKIVESMKVDYSRNGERTLACMYV